MKKSKRKKFLRPRQNRLMPFLTGTYASVMALGIFMLFRVLFAWDLIFGGRTYISPDQQTAGALTKPLAAYYERIGVVPLWSPYIFCGMPSFASTMYNADIGFEGHLIGVFLKNPFGLIMLGMLIVFGLKWRKLPYGKIVNMNPKTWAIQNCMRLWFVVASTILCLLVAFLMDDLPFRFVIRSIIWFTASGFLVLFMGDVYNWSVRQEILTASGLVVWIFYL